MNNSGRVDYKLLKQKRKEWKEEKLLKKLKKEIAATETENNEVKEPPKAVSPSTISIAVPGSILDNAQSCELRAYVAGQIARAACIFQIDEVVIFDDDERVDKKVSRIEDETGVQTASRASVQFARLLQYLECPQYLRKQLFPVHKDLQYAGLMNPLDAPHHLRQNDKFTFREGVITTKPVGKGNGSYADVGLLKDVKVDKVLTPGIRVTVRLLPRTEESKKQRGIIVSPSIPRAETGVYWGYNVRLAKKFSDIFSQSPYEKGYDLLIGTSDKGTSVDEVGSLKFNHAIIVFGGLRGLEAILENDQRLNVDDPALLFDHYLNTLPCQGSRTIRTEEAVLVTLAALRIKLVHKHEVKSFVNLTGTGTNGS